MSSSQDHDHLITFSRSVLDHSVSISTQAEMNQLVEAVKYHEWRYYILNEPILSDTEYDRLFKALESVELLHPEWKQSHSPTERVALDLTDQFVTVPHLTPMLSLANSYDENDLREFDAALRKVLKMTDDVTMVYSVEPKFDGGSISLVYENDRLVRGATRGNGVEGEDITNNIKAMRSIPLTAPFSRFGITKAEVRGEGIISKHNFERLNQIRLEEGVALFANARNAATGGLRTKDPNDTKDRHIEAFIFSLAFAEQTDGFEPFESHFDTLLALETLGFKVPAKAMKKCQSIDEVISFCQHWSEYRDQFGYEIDGMVIKLDKRADQIKAGFTTHHPRWAIAYKFQAKQAATKLLGIEFQVGKIGSITPVGKLEPVSLAGVTISSVSLHNEEFIRSRDLRIGDMVVVERAGDVIPYIVKSLEDLRQDGMQFIIEFPEYCPSCHSPLIKEIDEAAWRCVNTACPAQQIQKLIFFVSKDAMDIDGFGKSYVEKFYELGWLKDFSDIYQLDFGEIAQLEGFGEKSAKKLKDAIEKSKSNPIHRLLHALSIHHLGQKASKIISAEISQIFDLISWRREDYEAIKEIGPVLAGNMVSFFEQPSNIDLLRALESLGVNMVNQNFGIQKALGSGPLAGKTILFTGTLQLMGRKEAQDKAEAAGAKNISAVSSNLDYLVVGENAGSKLKKAEALGNVIILTEEAFLEMI